MNCYHCGHEMVWKHEYEEDVQIEEGVTKTYLTTNLECTYCPTTVRIVHEMPAEYIATYSESSASTTSESSVE